MRLTVRHVGMIALLALLVLVSAIAVAWSKHETRKQFTELHALRVSGDALEMEWGRLLLEQGTWSTHSRIERVASKRIDMHHPETRSVVMLPVTAR